MGYGVLIPHTEIPLKHQWLLLVYVMLPHLCSERIPNLQWQPRVQTPRRIFVATTVQHFNIAWSGFSCSCWIKPKKQPWMTFYLSHRKARHKCFEMSSYLCTVEQEYSSTTKSPCLEQHSSHWNRKGFYATHPSPALRLFGSRIIPEEWAVFTCRTWQWEMQWSSSL